MLDGKKNVRFQVRETEEGLKKLDEALKRLGYSSRTEWYREKKRDAIKEAAEIRPN